jgi:hypothetical protein
VKGRDGTRFWVLCNAKVAVCARCGRRTYNIWVVGKEHVGASILLERPPREKSNALAKIFFVAHAQHPKRSLFTTCRAEHAQKGCPNRIKDRKMASCSSSRRIFWPNIK